ncbi:MAG: DUF2294 domain-containing protein [Deltaproteobacteria bacterium]|nr:DUF2294 domain-containing protein [Deltaproteobacteria bacterium]
MRSFETIKEKLAERIYRWYEEEMGITPSSVSVMTDGELMFIRFKNVISRSEVILSGEPSGKELLREVNERLSMEVLFDVSEIVYEFTGLGVQELRIDDSYHLREKTYILTLNGRLEDLDDGWIEDC